MSVRSIPYPVLLAGAPFVGMIPALLFMPSHWPVGLTLSAGMSAWLLTMWRSARPDLIGALFTGPALGAPMLGAYQTAGGAISVGSVAGFAALAWGVGAARWAWDHCVGAFRRSEKVLGNLRGLAPDTADALFWLVTRDELHGWAKDSGPDLDRLVGVLHTAGGTVHCTVAERGDGTTTQKVHAMVNDVMVRVHLTTAAPNQ